LLGIIERFDLRNEFPDGRTQQKIKEHGSYQYLSAEFRSVIDTYRKAEEQRGVKKARTIHLESINAATFLYELQCAGISAIEGITRQSVIALFLNKDGALRRSCSYKKIVAVEIVRQVACGPVRRPYAKIVGLLSEPFSV
jgi:hypothetical protein